MLCAACSPSALKTHPHTLRLPCEWDHEVWMWDRASVTHWQRLRGRVALLAREGAMLNVTDGALRTWTSCPETLSFLQGLLDDPLAEVFGVGSVLPSGGLRDGHLAELFALADSLQANFTVEHGNRSYALHVWLYHLLGGARAGLLAPTIDLRANASRRVGKACETVAANYDASVRRAKKVRQADDPTDSTSDVLASSFVATWFNTTSTVESIRSTLQLPPPPNASSAPSEGSSSEAGTSVAPAAGLEATCKSWRPGLALERARVMHKVGT